MTTFSSPVNDDFDADETLVKPLYLYLLPIVLMLLEPLLAWSLGLGHLETARKLDPLSQLLRASALVAAIHVLLVGPVLQFAYPEIAKVRVLPLRVFFLCLLLFPPLFSFGYYVGNLKHESAFFELFWDLFPLVLVGALLYEKTRRTFILSLGLSLPIYFRFFVVGGIFGPFDPLFSWIPSADSLNLFRVVYGILLMGLSMGLSDRENWAKPTPIALATRERGICFLFLMAGGLALQFGLAFWVRQPELAPSAFTVVGESLYLLFPICLLLSLNPKPWAQKLYSSAIYLGLFTHAWSFSTRATSGDASLWNCFWLAFQGLGLTAFYLASLSRKQTLIGAKVIHSPTPNASR